MRKNNLNDKNSLLEVHLEWFIGRDCNVDKIGKNTIEPSLGIYCIIHKKTNKYAVVMSQPEPYNNKQIKKDITKHKKALTYFYPLTKECQKMNKESLEEMVVFFEREKDSKIEFASTQDFIEISEFLKNE